MAAPEPVKAMKQRYTWAELATGTGLLPMPSFPTAPAPPAPPPHRATAAPDPVSVYVRVRPLLQGEREAGEEVMPGLAAASSPEGEPAVAVETEKAKVGGFAGLLGPEADNEEVFRRVLAPRLDTAVQGGTASLFCYGYTGSGKSHTVLGSGGQEGLYRQAAGSLLDSLRAANPDTELFLVATAAEIYGDQVFDLLGEEKLPATLRTDAWGGLCISGPASRAEVASLLPGLESLGRGERATLVTRTQGLRTAVVRTLADLDTFAGTVLQQRAVGSSSEHAASSRSHALLRMEVVDGPLLEAREAAEEARVLLPALLNAKDNHVAEVYKTLLDFDSMDKYKETVGLRQYPGGPAEWEEARAGLVARQAALEAAAGPVFQLAERAFRRLEVERARDGPGGALVLVDLAGADYDHRDTAAMADPGERKESIEINKSLLALKECFRSLGGAYGARSRAVFRGSKLTRLLEDALLPGESCQRSSRAASSVMVVNVSPVARIANRTLNVLRYGQVFAQVGKAGARGAGGVRGQGARGVRGQGAGGVRGQGAGKKAASAGSIKDKDDKEIGKD